MSTKLFDAPAHMPAGLATKLERAARVTGLSLSRLELLGNDPILARGFVESVRSGVHEVFVENVDWHGLEARWWSQAGQTTVNPEVTA